jgi:hypothetical protein
MPRQNFLSRESFVEATELQAKESLLSIPVFAPNIKLIEENKKLQCYKFVYQIPQKNLEYCVDVTLLPLDTQFTRISLHGTHCDGQAFDNDHEMAIALHDFESAINAALKGDVSSYQPYKPKEKRAKSFFHIAAGFIASSGIFVLGKKLS